ncbi:MAG: FlgD immunoglobulin-like domain containing protein [bacterium]
MVGFKNDMTMRTPGPGPCWHGPESITLGSFDHQNWYKVRIGFRKVGSDSADVSYWIDDLFINEVKIQLPEEPLKYVGLGSGDSKAWFDDVKVYGISTSCAVVAEVGCDEFCYGDTVEVPIIIDMTGMNPPDDKLGSFTGSLDWDSNLLAYVSDSGILADFTGVVNVSPGNIAFNGANPTGGGGEVTVLIVTFSVVGQDSSTGVLDLDCSAMAAALTFTDLLPCLTVYDCEFHISAGLCGDINDDGLCNSTDALIFLSYDVGLPIPQPFLDKINAGCCDINNDGLCNSTDALILLSYDVGIPVPFCVCECCCPCPGVPTLKTISVAGAKASASPSDFTLAKREKITVPVEVDVAETSERLGSFTAKLDWTPKVLRFVGYSGGTTPGFADPVVNTDGVSSGHLVLANASAEGAAGVVNLINVEFEAIGPEGSFSPLEVRFSALTAAYTFSDLLSGLDVVVSRGISIGQLPTTFALDQNYPNPFNPETAIGYQLPETGHVTLAIYNVLGEKIRTLVASHLDAGRYSAVWDGRDESGHEVASGMYIYRLEVGDFVMARKMLLLK